MNNFNPYGSYMNTIGQYNNPYLTNGPTNQMTLQAPNQAVNIPPTQVPKVAGENGARLYMMGANSTALLLDMSGQIAWLVATDSAGNKYMVEPYDLIPHKSAPTPAEETAVKYDDLSERVTSLAKKVTKLEDIINGNTANTTTPSTSTAKRKPGGKPDDSAD